MHGVLLSMCCCNPMLHANSQSVARMCRYRKASAEIFNVFKAFFPSVVLEKASIDEAYLGALLMHLAMTALVDMATCHTVMESM